MAGVRRERKVVTVLFADLVGFTARAETLDPEDVEAILAPYHGRLRVELERHGGTVEKFIGDAVMALFGAPVAHEDDPERAVRAALAIRDWARETEGLEVRIGVTTGEALVNVAARPDLGEGMAAGDVVNTAARLQSAAPTNAVLVGETTYWATRDAIEYAGAEPVEAKGKSEPVAVWKALETRARVAVEGGGPGPLVGRERELDQVRDAFERARTEPAPQLVTLVGVPGIGKSRLVFELSRFVEDEPDLVYWRQGRSLPYGTGVAFWALGEMVKAQAGILESDASDVAARKLGEAVDAFVEVESERPWLLEHLRPLVGLGTDLGAERGESFAAWRRFFEALAERRPLVLVFEDLHWADDALLDFVDELVDWIAGVPLLVACTARPELLERRPGWGGGKRNSLTVSLGPLADDETARVLAGALDQSVLPAETQRALLARAAGNPLYAEQYARMLSERGEEALDALPETVQGIIAARLDSLPPPEKALLQNASVLGRTFWVGALSAVGGEERAAIEESLHALVRKEFVRRERRSSVAGETEFVFAHLLVRDVAYGQIPRADRVEKHRLAAEWLEALAPDRAEDRAEMLAHHYLAALELAQAAGIDAGALAEPARLALRDAGDRASALNAHAAAERLYASALDLWPADDSGRAHLLFRRARAHYLWDETGIEMLAEARDALLAGGDMEAGAEAEMLLADVIWREGRREEAMRHMVRARELIAGEPPSRVQALILSNVSRYHMLGGEIRDAIAVGREALAQADQLGLEDVRSHALNNIGVGRVNIGEEAGLDDLRSSIDLAVDVGSPFDTVRGWINLGATLHMLGYEDESRTAIDEADLIAKRFGYEGGVRWSRGTNVPRYYHEGRWDESLRSANEFIAESEAGAPHYLTGESYCIRALLLLARADREGAKRDARRGLELTRSAGDPQLAESALANAAYVFAALDSSSESEAVLNELLGSWRTREQVGFAVTFSHHAAWAAWKLGRADGFLDALGDKIAGSRWLEVGRAFACGEFVAAADIASAMRTPPAESLARFTAGELLIEAGRRDEGEAELRKALAFYRDARATWYLGRAEALLAASA